MDEATRTRRAARAAVQDIDPERLHDVIAAVVDEGSMAPGALTLLAARSADDGVDLDSLDERAAGVQLIYDGLRLTRRLSHDEPWATATDQTDANLDVLAADVLVSRGFYLLARTEAADKAVATVRAFGRDQTLRREAGADAEALDGNLEVNVLELAVIAGASAVGAQPTTETLDRVASLARSGGTPLPAAETLLPDAGDEFATRPGVADGGEEGVRPSATDP